MGISAIVSMIAGNARPCYWWFFGLLLSIHCIAPPIAAAALSPSDVLVLYNADNADSRDIANYYAQKRPGVRLFGLTGITSSEEVSADYYLSNIRPQVLSALDDSVDVIVTTKGLPLRIRVAQSNPGTYIDPNGISRSVGSWDWKKCSSLESELTRIDSISTWQQMGDQTTRFSLVFPAAVNPYYWQSGDFSHQQYGTRLTSRLDGFTVADVQGMIDRAGNAYVAAAGASNPFHFVIDDDPNAAGSAADNMERLRDVVLQPRGLSFTYDPSDAFVQAPAVAKPNSSVVLGYVSHGVHGGAPSNYLVDPIGGIQFRLANGAVFASWESYNAQTFELGVSHSQGLVAEWIARGGTAGLGHVAEPLANSTTVAREDNVFNRLLSGMSWAEAAWSSTYQLSYVNTVVGDPLMRFQTWVPGDLNLSGRVDGGDLAIVLLHLNQFERNQGFYEGDLNGDGVTTTADLSIVLANFFKSSNLVQTDSAGGSAAGAPEPASSMLAGVALVTALTCSRRASRLRSRP